MNGLTDEQTVQQTVLTGV